MSHHEEEFIHLLCPALQRKRMLFGWVAATFCFWLDFILKQK